MFRRFTSSVFALLLVPALAAAAEPDTWRAIQSEAVENGRSPYMHWGGDPADYDGYDSHSNRLVPVYLLGAGDAVSLGDWSGANSAYRDASRLRDLYGRVPSATLNENADYFDQTDVYRMQADALKAGYRHVFLVVFDGMDWPTIELARLANRAADREDLSFVSGGERPWQSGALVTSPWGEARNLGADEQTIGDAVRGGGYDPDRGGAGLEATGDPDYLVGRPGHDVADSASSAVSMTTGRKTINGAINVSPEGKHLRTIVHAAQEKGLAVGTVTSVPFNHATPASAYAHNVTRRDYQDLARDMLGLPSIAHPDKPLTGLDVVIGAGWGAEREYDAQGRNYVSGNRFIADDDLARIDAANDGRYRVVQRGAGVDGSEALETAAGEAREKGLRLFGLFGTRYSHLPYSTADGSYNPAPSGGGAAEQYNEADIAENPTLAEMTSAALTVLAADGDGFWLMVEPGDVDWAAHGNNVDSMLGAMNDGDEAVRRIIEWVEANSNWKESLLIVTADHGHLLTLDDREALRERLEKTEATP